jgi:hypothetical protein
MPGERNTAEVKPVAACVPEGFKLSDAIATMAQWRPCCLLHTTAWGPTLVYPSKQPSTQAPNPASQQASKPAPAQPSNRATELEDSFAPSPSWAALV